MVDLHCFRKAKAHSSLDQLYLRTIFKDSAIGYLVQDTAEMVSTKQGPQLLGSTLATQVSPIQYSIS